MPDHTLRSNVDQTCFIRCARMELNLGPIDPEPKAVSPELRGSPSISTQTLMTGSDLADAN